jgi:hypothetical protein
VLLDFKKPFDLIPYYKRSYEEEIFAKTPSKNFNFPSGNSPSMIWSGRQDLNLWPLGSKTKRSIQSRRSDRT